MFGFKEVDNWIRQEPASKVKLIDIVFVEHKRRTEQDLTAIDDWEFTEPARMRQLVHSGFDFGERAHARKVARLVRFRQSRHLGPVETFVSPGAK